MPFCKINIQNKLKNGGIDIVYKHQRTESYSNNNSRRNKKTRDIPAVGI